MWEWVLLWALIVVVGGLWLVLLGREVVRKGARLLDEVAAAAAVLEAAGRPATRPAVPPDGGDTPDTTGTPDAPGPRGFTMAVRDPRR